MKKYKGWQVGQFLSVKHSVSAYYSGYGGLPIQSLLPWQVARISVIAPKVRMARTDREPYMLVVDFIGYRDERVWRASVELKNAVKAERPSRYVVA